MYDEKEKAEIFGEEKCFFFCGGYFAETRGFYGPKN